MAAGKLNARQQRFVEEYIVDLDAAAAYSRAGYKPRSEEAAGAAARRLLQNVTVSAAIAAAQKARAARTHTAADRVVRELKRLAFSDIGEVVDFSGQAPAHRAASAIPRRARRAIQSVKVTTRTTGSGPQAATTTTVEYRLWSKTAALDSLCKHLGLFPREPPDPPPGPTDATCHPKDDPTPEDVAAARRLVAEAGAGVPADGDPQPVDPRQPPPPPAPVPPSL